MSHLKSKPAPPNPSGLCMCGCGETTAIAPISDYQRRGYVRGEHVRFVRGHQSRLTTPRYLVEERGHTTPCHIWQRCINSDGYGTVRINGTLRHAHIVEWESANGPVPNGLQLDHLCRVRCCVKPDHMEPVTRAVNIQRGANARLTTDQVRRIRDIGDTMTRAQLAEMFGVQLTTIRCVLVGETWSNID